MACVGRLRSVSIQKFCWKTKKEERFNVLMLHHSWMNHLKSGL